MIARAARNATVTVATLLLATAAAATPMPPPADPQSVACGVGRRATLADGRVVRVTSADADGRCHLAVYGGGSATVLRSELRFEPAPTLDLASPPISGVYACQPHGMGLDPATSFGLVDASTWRNAAGERGDYRYDASSQVLELVSGPWAGRRFLRNSATTFQVPDTGGKVAPIGCVLDPDRDVGSERW